MDKKQKLIWVCEKFKMHDTLADLGGQGDHGPLLGPEKYML